MAKKRTSKTEAPPKKMRTLTVKLAKEGKRIPQPANGRRMEFEKEYEVPDAPFWRRRIRDGDLTLVKGPDMPKGTPVIHGKDKDAADKKPATGKK